METLKSTLQSVTNHWWAPVVVCTLLQSNFGLWAVLAHWATEPGRLTPVVFVFWRNLIATPAIWIYTLLTVGVPTVPDKEDIARIVFLGLTGVTLNQFFVVLGNEYSTPVNTALMQLTIPIMTAFFAAALGQEKIDIRTAAGRMKVAGLASALTGAAIVIVMGYKARKAAEQDPGVNDNGPTPYELLLGNVFLLVNCVSCSLFMVAQVPMIPKYGSKSVQAWAHIAGLIGMTIATASLTDFKTENLYPTDGPSWGVALYAGLIASGASYILTGWAIGKTSASFAMGFVPLQPVAASVIAILLLGIYPTWAEIGGGFMVLLGLSLLISSRSRETHDTKFGNGNIEFQRIEDESDDLETILAHEA
eukprot:Clim_evm35s152 gene=Clim_evmTU35s152